MTGIIGSAALALAFQTTPCESLTSFTIENGTIATADSVPEGPFVRPGGGRGRGGPAGTPEPIPAHCRVRMVLTPTDDSRINVELWMPAEDWNGRFLAVGNGGFAGSIQGYGNMQAALRRGYATAGTDTGHSNAEDGPGGMFGLGHPEKIVDFAYRAVHDMTVKSKRVIDAYYAEPLAYSYFQGCSTGGRQAMMAAQRYPGDFDGIIAGALANRHIYMHTAGVARNIRVARNPDEAISEELAGFVSDAVMNQCDTLGEGFLNNPRQCAFDFASLLCSNGSGSADGGLCLTAPQLRSVETWYGGVRNSRGEMIFSGQALGNPMRPMLGMGANATVSDTVRIWGFQDENYDWREFDLDRDMPIIDAAVGFVDADNPDLRGFQGHGGKLLLYTGWRDTAITPENTVAYYESVLEEMGEDQDDWMRLFMAPGMGHCGGGPGPNTFDALTTMERWREQRAAPDQIMASNPANGLTRPLCPYPQYAQYDGSGSLADAANWSRAAP